MADMRHYRKVDFVICLPHSKEQCVNQNRDIHKEAAVTDVIEVILDVLVDRESSVGAQLPQAVIPGVT